MSHSAKRRIVVFVFGVCLFFKPITIHHKYITIQSSSKTDGTWNLPPSSCQSSPGEYGDLYKVTLTHDEDLVSEVQVKYFDTVPLSNALCASCPPDGWNLTVSTVSTVTFMCPLTMKLNPYLNWRCLEKQAIPDLSANEFTFNLRLAAFRCRICSMMRIP